MSPSRQRVRSDRRKEIDSKLRHRGSVNDLMNAICVMPAHLRSTCVLDIEEYLIEKNVELIVQNPWWSNTNLKKLWESLRRNGLA